MRALAFVLLLLLWASPASAAITNAEAPEFAQVGSTTTRTSSAFTPTANRLYLWAIFLSVAGGDPGSVSSVTSTTGLTFVQVATATVGTTGDTKVFVFRALKPSGLGSGTVTVTASVLQDLLMVQGEGFDGIDTTGTNGSGAIAQSNTGNCPTNCTRVATTLAAATSGTYLAAVWKDASGGFLTGAAPDAGFTALWDGNAISAGSELLTAWRNDNATAPGGTQSDGLGPRGAIVAVRLANATGGVTAIRHRNISYDLLRRLWNRMR